MDNLAIIIQNISTMKQRRQLGIEVIPNRTTGRLEVIESYWPAFQRRQYRRKLEKLMRVLPISGASMIVLSLINAPWWIFAVNSAFIVAGIVLGIYYAYRMR